MLIGPTLRSLDVFYNSLDIGTLGVVLHQTATSAASVHSLTLRYLDAMERQTPGLAAIPPFSHLKVLRIHSIGRLGWNSLAQCPRLEIVTIFTHKPEEQSDDLEKHVTLPKLTALDLLGQIMDPLPSHILCNSTMPSLLTIHVAVTDIPPGEYASQLTSLAKGSPLLEDVTLFLPQLVPYNVWRAFSSFRSLGSLKLDSVWKSSKMSDTDFELLARSMPRLRFFSMVSGRRDVPYTSRFSEKLILSFACHCPALEELEVHVNFAACSQDNPSTNAVLEPFKALTRLFLARLQINEGCIAKASSLLATICPDVDSLEYEDVHWQYTPGYTNRGTLLYAFWARKEAMKTAALVSKRRV